MLIATVLHTLAICSCRERELQLQTETAKEEEDGRTGSRSSDPQPHEQNTGGARAATTRELIAASMIEQAKSFMTEVIYF